MHACTSTTSALGSRRVHSTLSAYFNEDRPLDNTLVRGNRPHACRWLKSDAAFAWASFRHGLYIQLIAAALRVSGNPKASHRVRSPAAHACLSLGHVLPHMPSEFPSRPETWLTMLACIPAAADRAARG